ncbi:hypothetical protein [Enterococcus wangshanyuanii]|uniref:Uncharacterized protein n=1 Tax=Enterococcus wangshanyuanii TaxID=2005703 RepID=A0ABQ1P7S1_9ENTE|nr:hypothetical protein [Enterococcus wangshanyuanii]GGC92807.1 hypothetical protein GCM10011573_23010 [Enterococcus wangshanyuanii]
MEDGEWMNKPVEISNQEWSDLTKKVDAVETQAEYNKNRLNRHSDRLDSLEDQQIALPLAIQQAVENGMAPVLEKLLMHDEKFVSLELLKEREQKEALQRKIDEDKDRRKWFIRTVIASVIGSIGGVAGVIRFFIMINNK